MSRVRIHRGTEGPRHDPCSYENITVTRANGDQVTFHSGLDIWAEAKFASGHGFKTDDPEDSADLFTRVAGVTVRTAERAFRETLQRPYRFHICGEKYLKGVDGYPGEHFVVCGKCGDVLEVQFSLSEVI